VTSALVGAARESMRVSAWKPVTSGGLDDVARLTVAAGEPIGAPLHALGAPVSPHLAARHEGIAIDVRTLVGAAIELAKHVDVLFVESAGGLYSPLSDNDTNADVARALGGEAQLLLVAPDRLGVLHDVGAVVRAARADGRLFAAVALSAPEHADASTGTNAAEIQKLGLALDVVTFPRAPSLDDEATRRAATACLSAFGVLSRPAAARR
jgi:dethiobiotin synthetase